jgi:hypothetical protein
VKTKASARSARTAPERLRYGVLGVEPDPVDDLAAVALDEALDALGQVGAARAAVVGEDDAPAAAASAVRRYEHAARRPGHGAHEGAPPDG